MRLAIVTSSFPLFADDSAAAAGLFVRDVSRAMAEAGHDVNVITQDKGAGCRDAPAGVSVRCFPWPGDARPLSSLRMTSPSDAHSAATFLRNGTHTLRVLHNEHPIDHVIAMWAVPAGLMARSLKRSAGVPYSAWCLGSDIWTYGRIPVLRRVVRGVLRGAHRCYADGVELARDAERISGVDVPFLPSSRLLDQAAAIEAIDWGQGSPRLLFIGRYAPVKGVDVLLHAIRLVRDAGCDVSLRMLGGGEWDEHVRDLVRTLGLTDCVTVGGYADLPTVVSHAKACDALVIPSRMESIPLVLSDALQLGKPVIVSDVGDMGELIRENPAGLVVPPADETALAAAIQEFAGSAASVYDEQVRALASRFDLRAVCERLVADAQP